MADLILSQVKDAVVYAEVLGEAMTRVADSPGWGGGERLILPNVIPLCADFSGDKNPALWLVANDFEGYDITTTDPTKTENA